jgi:hypothetical protein
LSIHLLRYDGITQGSSEDGTHGHKDNAGRRSGYTLGRNAATHGRTLLQIVLKKDWRAAKANSQRNAAMRAAESPEEGLARRQANSQRQSDKTSVLQKLKSLPTFYSTAINPYQLMHITSVFMITKNHRKNFEPSVTD